MNGRFLLFFLLLSFVACNEGKKADEKKPASLPPQYYYFPRANVYFDSANKEYVFLSGDGATWQTAKQIPNVVQGLMDKSVLIPDPAQPVWQDNERHKLVYSALLYATPDDTVAKKTPPKPGSKTPPRPPAKEEKKRKGLGKIVNKIFDVFRKDKKKDSVE